MWNLTLGANVTSASETTFTVWAPQQESLSVSFADGSSLPLERSQHGVYTGVSREYGPGDCYSLRLHNGDTRPDPVSRSLKGGVHGTTEIVSTDSFTWTDEDWNCPPLSELVLYELHVGTFSKHGTFAEVAEALPYFQELGINAIELLPIAQFPGTRNWGYDGVQLFSPHSAYGGYAQLKELVNEAHRAGIAVFLDVVYNHLGPEGNYLAEFAPYFTDRHHTPWGRAINFDDRGSDHVREFFLSNALYWLEELHIDGLRLDAVHAIYDFSALHILEELAERVAANSRQSGKRKLLVAESDLNDPRLVSPRSAGGYGLDGQWSDDFHHSVHALLTGESKGYYSDYGSISHLEKAIENNFVYDGTFSEFRNRRHGRSSHYVGHKTCVISIQNHDQVGNRAAGERLGALVDEQREELAACLLLLSPQVPMLFMGEEYGEENPFLYFVDHGDKELLEAVRRGRRAEFSSFDWQGDVPDPAAEETFLRSKIDRGKRESSAGARRLALYKKLIALNRSETALRDPGVTVGTDVTHSLLSIEYRSDSIILAKVLANLSDQTVDLPMDRPGGDIIFQTDSVASSETSLTLPAYGACCLRFAETE